MSLALSSVLFISVGLDWFSSCYTQPHQKSVLKILSTDKRFQYFIITSARVFPVRESKCVFLFPSSFTVLFLSHLNLHISSNISLENIPSCYSNNYISILNLLWFFFIKNRKTFFLPTFKLVYIYWKCSIFPISPFKNTSGCLQ